jgi:ESCRT-I complex subunit VPS28
MLKLVGDDVSSLEGFMSRYRVSTASSEPRAAASHKARDRAQMDLPAALHRLQVGVPATVEHSSEAGPETGKWIAETTQVRTPGVPRNVGG